MAELKVTQEILDIIGTTRENLISEIRLYENTKILPSEQQKGKKGRISEKTIFLDETEVPEAFRPKSVDTSKPQDNETSRLLAQAEVYKAETLKIKAEIELTIIKGERDRPDILKQKELDVVAKNQYLEDYEKSLKTRENAVILEKNNLNIREQVLKNNEVTLAQKFLTTDAEIQQKRDLADSLNLQLSQEDDKITKEISRKKLELETLKSTIEQVKKEAEPVVSWLTKWANWTNGQATKLHTQKNYDQANALWQKSDTLTKLKQKLGF